MRVGQGFDVHRFGDGDHVILGGVRRAHDRGLLAQSDGDVVLHALADALLGALALGDIGHFFPDTDAQYRNADSRALLRMVYARIRAAGYCLGNADMTVIAQAPRMAPYIDTMVERIAADLQCLPEQVSVKATTTERLGFAGRKEGIAAQALVLLVPQSN